jgi:hypothetical protein
MSVWRTAFEKRGPMGVNSGGKKRDMYMSRQVWECECFGGAKLTEQAFDAVDDDDAEWTLVAVCEDLADGGYLLALGESDHLVW